MRASGFRTTSRCPSTEVSSASRDMYVTRSREVNVTRPREPRVTWSREVNLTRGHANFTSHSHVTRPPRGHTTCSSHTQVSWSSHVEVAESYVHGLTDSHVTWSGELVVTGSRSTCGQVIQMAQAQVTCCAKFVPSSCLNISFSLTAAQSLSVMGLTDSFIVQNRSFS